ncbi:unnamed protein product [Didymodactylos carnosus]|uniref:Uncharacterized protein n=1 Tax=Didymodactylos carnosus TaxID=1234261 RepID=A0A815ZCN2_9BILA|nr:unnamed protein product [Didymodactylos carnosus]CAF4451565.1 unnamed protein product [Didymodactylos carnosus]
MLLISGWHATLLARDGDVLSGIPRQLSKLPKDATHLFISIGGNNALGYMIHLHDSVKNLGEALISLHKIKSKFQKVRKKCLKICCTVKNIVSHFVSQLL